MKLKTNEQQTVKAILQYLTLRRIKRVHIRTTGNIIQKDGKTFFGRGHNEKGCPDILCAFHGVPIAIEVKSDTGRVSPEQKEWLEEWERSPSEGVWIVARSVGDVEALLETIK